VVGQRRRGDFGLAVLVRPGVLRVLIVTVACLTAAFTVSTYLPAVVAPVAAGTVLSWVFFASGGAAVVGNAVGGRWAGRRNPLVVMRVACVGLAASLAVLPLAVLHLATLLLVVAVWGAFGWMTVVPQQHRLLALAPDAALVLLGWNASATYAGAALGSLLGGAVLQGSSPAWLGSVGAVVALAAPLLTWLRVPTARRQPAASPALSAANTVRA
jgi:predicted MFS family arabinose efflux permease